MRSIVIILSLSLGCDAQRTGTGTNAGGPGHDLGPGGVLPDDLSFDHDAFFINDPPPMYCGVDGGVVPSPPGGTLQCPDDKNIEGCPCPVEGMTAPCWPGLRANRNLGICKDGTTTCTRIGEIGLGWGACMGAVLPQQGATSGAEACKCFSHGQWAIANTVPCLGMTTAFSSSDPTGMSPACPGAPAAGSPWSNDTLTVDCAGTYTLCYTIKAGDATKPSPSDCVLEKSCTMGYYGQVGMAQTFPQLPSWTSSDATCIQSFTNNGGYGEMSVHGTSLLCDMIPDHVFQRVTYCKLSCMPGSTDPACAMCGNGGSGGF